MGVASRLVPTLNGVDGHRLTRLWGPFLLLNVGCTLRVLGQTLTDFTAAAFPVTGVSGLLEVTALALWGAHLWSVMAGWPHHRLPATTAYAAGTPIEAGHPVGEVLDRHPELLETFVSLGFRPLANPVLRATVARHVSIAQASRQVGLDPERVIDALERA